MLNEKENSDINKIGQQIEHLNNNINQLGDSFHRIANVTEKMAETCIKKFLKRPFFLQPSFWTAFIAVSGLLGLLLTWQQQVKTMEADNIQKQIRNIQNFKAKENKAIIEARAVIVNQNLSCPINKISTLKKFQKERLNSLINVTAYDSNLTFSENPSARKTMEKLITLIFNLEGNDICKINSNKFDHKLQRLQTQMNAIVNQNIKHNEIKLKKMESKWIL